ncbi:hypothetical protein [Streptomyces chartreusis]
MGDRTSRRLLLLAARSAPVRITQPVGIVQPVDIVQPVRIIQPVRVISTEPSLIPPAPISARPAFEDEAV